MKSVQRTDRLQNATRATGGAVILHAEHGGGTRKIRCTRCQAGYMMKANSASGTPILKCQCGASATVRKM